MAHEEEEVVKYFFLFPMTEKCFFRIKKNIVLLENLLNKDNNFIN